jgi:hypothetical protein
MEDTNTFVREQQNLNVGDVLASSSDPKKQNNKEKWLVNIGRRIPDALPLVAANSG